MNNIPVNIPQANGFILKTQQIQSDSRICERAEYIDRSDNQTVRDSCRNNHFYHLICGSLTQEMCCDCSLQFAACNVK